MSTKQTDAHNQNLQDRLEDEWKDVPMSPDEPGIEKANEEDDPDSRGQELKEQADERRAEQMDAHFAPAEGNVY